MTASTINKINAVAPDTATVRPFKSMPLHLTASALVTTLQSLGLMVPTSLTAAAGKGQQLRTAEHRLPLREVDAALSKHDVPITDRFRLKQAMVHNQILGN